MVNNSSKEAGGSGRAALKHLLAQRARITACALAQVFQRQMSKEGLQTVVNNSSKDAGGSGGGGGGADSGLAANLMSAEELRDLFSLRQHTLSDTFDSMCSDEAEEAGDGGAVCAEVHKAQVGHDVHQAQTGMQSTVHTLCPHVSGARQPAFGLQVAFYSRKRAICIASTSAARVAQGLSVLPAACQCDVLRARDISQPENDVMQASGGGACGGGPAELGAALVHGHGAGRCDALHRPRAAGRRLFRILLPGAR